MMAEMPPGGQRQQPPPMTPMRQGIGFDRGYFFSIPGILTTIALICAFCAMISVEVGKSYGVWGGSVSFHEFTTITSWLTFLIFTGTATMQLYRSVSIRGSVMKFIMIGHSATWSLLTLISSAILLDAMAKSTWLPCPPGMSCPTSPFPAMRAAGAFGLLECFSLMGVTVLLVLDLLNIFRTPLFD